MRKDDLGDPYGLYEESYWDSVRAKTGPPKEKEGHIEKGQDNAGSKDQAQGRGDSIPDDQTETRPVHSHRRNPKKRAKRRSYRRRPRPQD